MQNIAQITHIYIKEFKTERNLKMFKFNDTLMMLVRKNLDTNAIPMLLGEPGIGKSSWLENLAKLSHTQCFTLACNQLADKADLTGARLVPISEQVVDDNGNVIGEKIVDYKQMFYPHAVISDAIDYAEKHPRENPILFLDELNRTTPDVTSEALSIPTMRSIGHKKLPNNLKVVIAGNDKGNITALDEASVSRFVLYHVAPDTSTFLAIHNDNLNPFIKNVLTAHPETIFCKQVAVGVVSKDDDDDDNETEYDFTEIIDDTEELTQITTPRTIAALSRWLNTFSNQELMTLLSETTKRDGEDISILQEAVEGHVGRTNFATLLMSEIANNVMNTNNQSSNINVGKPACYDTMKACIDIASLEDFFSTLSDNDKSGILLYSLYEQADNSVFIKTLAPHVSRLIPDDNKTLMKLAATDKLDAENVQTLLSTNTPLSMALSIILEN